MGPRIGIIDLGAANYASIAAALQRVGATTSFITTPRDLTNIDGLVFPGVAHLGFILDRLDAQALRAPVQRWLAADSPFLGICAGFQALFEGSDEAPDRRGLGIFDGRVRKVHGEKRQHMGWNRVEPVDVTMLRGWAYFAHAYAAPGPCDAAYAVTTYGESFVSVASRGKTTGMQFHPERSGAYGRALLGDFVELAGGVHAR